MCRCTWLCTPGSRMGMGKPANIAGRGELPAACGDAVEWRSPKLRLERARRLLRQYVIQRRRRATQALQGQEAVRQETQCGVVVEARPGASFEMVQPQLFLELLIPLLDVPARLPQPNRLEHGRLRRQVGQRVADRDRKSTRLNSSHRCIS